MRIVKYAYSQMGFVDHTKEHLLPFLFYIFTAFLAFTWSRFLFSFIREKLGRPLDSSVFLALALLLSIVFYLIVTQYMGTSTSEAIQNRKMYKQQK